MTVTLPPFEPTSSRGHVPSGSPRRIAVFGSVAAERPPRSVEAPSSSARTVLERIFAAITAQAPLIAQPILDRAVGQSTITLDERDELLRELADPQATGEAAAATRASDAGRAVLGEAFAAIRRGAPAIAEPILTEAVAAGRLTQAQARRILDRLHSSPAAAFRGARSKHHVD
jgi:hypothetical protein